MIELTLAKLGLAFAKPERKTRGKQKALKLNNICPIDRADLPADLLELAPHCAMQPASPSAVLLGLLVGREDPPAPPASRQGSSPYAVPTAPAVLLELEEDDDETGLPPDLRGLGPLIGDVDPFCLVDVNPEDGDGSPAAKRGRPS